MKRLEVHRVNTEEDAGLNLNAGQDTMDLFITHDDHKGMRYSLAGVPLKEVEFHALFSPEVALYLLYRIRKGE